MVKFPITHRDAENCNSEAFVLLVHNRIKLLHWKKYY